MDPHLVQIETTSVFGDFERRTLPTKIERRDAAFVLTRASG